MGNSEDYYFVTGVITLVFSQAVVCYLYQIILNKYNNKHCHLQIAQYFIKCFCTNSLILILIAALRNRYYFEFHFIDEKNKKQKTIVDGFRAPDST